MKKLLLTCLMSAALLPARAQFFSPEAFSGAALGAMIGGVAGGSSHSHGCHSYYQYSGNGAAIGAGIGLLAGALFGEANRRAAYAEQPAAYTPAPVATPGYSYETPYTYYTPNAYTAPGNYYRPNRPNYAVGGTLLGAASGALIGAGSDRAGQGAAIGAAAGLVLGGISEHIARRNEQQAAAQAQPVAATPSAPQEPQAPISPAQEGITSQPVPTSTYHWTTRPQIADAPRVPDAPTF